MSLSLQAEPLVAAGGPCACGASAEGWPGAVLAADGSGCPAEGKGKYLFCVAANKGEF